MSSNITEPAPAAVQEFVGRVVDDLGAAFSGVLVNVGRRLGLYRALAELGPCTSTELGAATGVRERYVREWLNNQVAGGYLTHDASSATYALPPAHALVLAEESSPTYMAPAFEVAASFWLDDEKIVQAFRSGTGIGWHEHNERLFCGTEMFFRAGYQAHLVADWLPALDGMVERLERGARVADIGCGHGASTLLMAQAFPASEFVGVDYHGASIAVAMERADALGTAANARFVAADAKGYPDTGFDLICFMDCLHDLGDPVGALAHGRQALEPDGKVMLVEPMAGDRLEDNVHPVGRMFYAASTMACTPNSLSQEVGLGLGAQAGEARLAAVAREAGFATVRRATETPVNLILELSP